MSKIGDKQFYAMCNMWGVDDAIKAAKRMGMIPTQKQIDAATQKEKMILERWENAFKHEPDSVTDKWDTQL